MDGDWTSEEESLLLQMRTQGMLFDEIACALKRSEYAVASKYLKLVPLPGVRSRADRQPEPLTNPPKWRNITIQISFQIALPQWPASAMDSSMSDAARKT